MIIFKVALTFLMLLAALAILAVFVDSLVDFRYCWLHELAESIISAFFGALAVALMVGFIFVCGLIIYEIWMQV